MKLKDLTKEELETMGYDEIACLVLEESGKKMKLIDLFTKVNKALDIPEEAYMDKIGDFFELLSINKKFIMLKNGYWDLQTKHKSEIIIEENEEDEEEQIEPEEPIENEPENEEEDIFYEGEETDDIEDDEFSDLVVIDEESEDTNI